MQVQPDRVVGDVVDEILSKLDLPRNDPGGAPIAWSVRSNRTSESLFDTETVGDAGLESGDSITVEPHISAG